MANDDNIAGPKRRSCGTETAIEVPFSVLHSHRSVPKLA